MNPIIYVPTSVSPRDFVAYWSALYPVEDDAELYSPNIGTMSPQAIDDLFAWKFGQRFAVNTQKSVQENVIPRLSELHDLPRDLTAEEFLARFVTGGAIFRIFLLHCWCPDRFPVYDQHVHRAMSVIESGQCEEIEMWSDANRISAYLRRYLPFHAIFVDSHQRSVDRALWSFGKFIKRSRLPRDIDDSGHALKLSLAT